MDSCSYLRTMPKPGGHLWITIAPNFNFFVIFTGHLRENLLLNYPFAPKHYTTAKMSKMELFVKGYAARKIPSISHPPTHCSTLLQFFSIFPPPLFTFHRFCHSFKLPSVVLHHLQAFTHLPIFSFQLTQPYSFFTVFFHHALPFSTLSQLPSPFLIFLHVFPFPTSYFDFALSGLLNPITHS